MKVACRIVAVLVLAFLLAPIVVVVLSSFFESGFIEVPLSQPSLKWYSQFFSSDEWILTAADSVVIAFVVAVASTALALTTALVTARRHFWGRASFEFMILVPLVLPHAAMGVVMLTVIGSLGWNGTYSGIVLAHTILALPFAYRPILNNMRSLEKDVEEAAMNLGATPVVMFFKVILPLMRPGIVTALIFSFIISFDESTVTLFLIGPDATTLPVKIFAAIQEDASPIISAISTMLIGATVFVLIAVQRLVGLEAFAEAEGGPGRR
ncbi:MULTISPECIES: ABC transporter permease [Bradyrhizobium]|uniref:ABC transporter permease n=3 Tax=Bradyrhizobium TaxID=374 RepID=A0AAE5X8B0_9BRAD|nr:MULTISPECIES: ABC transporter permease [Bradyrhizobium]MCG2629338.1 ABC transporter permease [Bradyrhizobium zhengyangense]MCG2644619.1 ABC transporter permease [Bradyrhizobium zhengyangense]MCG2670852.1 ABC transporter permease [Bradyrhizobium zhengyangense]MDN4984485.1 ABC transporter permease [Bradyrhizobium sp. WYCCWR 13022]MDN5002477.1 ABC transporter permease [Bradyrhizobium sp. WYCCWR 12677]